MIKYKLKTFVIMKILIWISVLVILFTSKSILENLIGIILSIVNLILSVKGEVDINENSNEEYN